MRWLITILAAAAVAGCGGQGKPAVCHVRPSSDGKTLLYSPAGCEHHLNGETLDIQSH